jgi:ribosomal protein S12 methylthiotransferase
MKNPVRVYLATLGCAKNLVDSERLMGALVSSGALIAASPEDADCLIVNTCGFISPAIDESIRTILKLARHKRDGEVARKLIVTGCLAERYAQALRKQLPEVDAVFGLESFDRILHACGLKSKKESPGRLLLTPSHTAYLRISDGCDNRCAYCTIPSIRGPYRSRPFPEQIGRAHV